MHLPTGFLLAKTTLIINAYVIVQHEIKHISVEEYLNPAGKFSVTVGCYFVIFSLLLSPGIIVSHILATELYRCLFLYFSTTTVWNWFSFHL